MIRINLLPFRAARKKENIRRQVSIFILFFVFTALALYYYNSVLNNQIKNLTSNFETVKKNLQAKRKDAREVDTIKKDLELLKIKMEGIRLVKQKRREPVQLLEYMTQMVIPKRMWFTSFTANDETVGITGVAMDQKTVADFMTRLEEITMFSAVNLSMLRQERFEGLDLKRFEVRCDKVKLDGTVKTDEKNKHK
jgi:type IV pilus assembly protein PilN